MNKSEKQNSETISAPFTDEQVKNITDWQTCGFVHEMTCNGSGGCANDKTCSRVLLVRNDKLICACGQTEQMSVPTMVATFNVETAKKVFSQLSVENT